MARVQQEGKLEAPLLPRTAGDEAATSSGRRVDGEGASFQGAVLNLSTTIIGAGIMSIPATVKVLGVLPALLVILAVALLSDISIEFLLRFTDAGTSTSYSGIMSESFGRLGCLILQLCVAVTTMGTMIVYLIIIGIIRPPFPDFLLFSFVSYYNNLYNSISGVSHPRGMHIVKRLPILVGWPIFRHYADLFYNWMLC